MDFRSIHGGRRRRDVGILRSGIDNAGKQSADRGSGRAEDRIYPPGNWQWGIRWDRRITCHGSVEGREAELSVRTLREGIGRECAIDCGDIQRRNDAGIPNDRDGGVWQAGRGGRGSIKLYRYNAKPGRSRLLAALEWPGANGDCAEILHFN